MISTVAAAGSGSAPASLSALPPRDFPVIPRSRLHILREKEIVHSVKTELSDYPILQFHQVLHPWGQPGKEVGATAFSGVRADACCYFRCCAFTGRKPIFHLCRPRRVSPSLAWHICTAASSSEISSVLHFRFVHSDALIPYS